MSTEKKSPGRPRLPDPEAPPVNPALSRLPAADLSKRDLEARRYADRMRMRRYRENRRRNRDNPQGLATGVDGLALIRAQADARMAFDLLDAERRQNEALRRDLAEATRDLKKARR